MKFKNYFKVLQRRKRTGDLAHGHTHSHDTYEEDYDWEHDQYMKILDD